MATTLNAGTTAATSLNIVTDTTGAMAIQTSGTTAIAISAAQAVTLTNPLPTGSGGTGTTSTTFANLTTNVTGTLPVANGGTGATTLTANNVLLGNGTSAPQFVAPGTSGNILVSNGTTWISASNAPPFASGTAMLFQQTSAPTGWTKVTTYNDYAVRIVSGTASTGGSSSFSTCFANQTPTINVSGLSAGATTLSTAQMPSHSHSGSVYNPSGGGAGYFFGGNAACGVSGTYTTGSQGGGGSHTHSISGSASSSAVTLAVQYVDHIIATKN